MRIFKKRRTAGEDCYPSGIPILKDVPRMPPVEEPKSIQFKNGSSIQTISDLNGSNRGERSNLITCNCYDLVTGDWVVKEIDLKKPLDRYIPEMFLELDASGFTVK